MVENSYAYARPGGNSTATKEGNSSKNLTNNGGKTAVMQVET